MNSGTLPSLVIVTRKPNKYSKISENIAISGMGVKFYTNLSTFIRCGFVVKSGDLWGYITQ